MDYSLINRDVYEILADEYENKVSSLMPITEESMTYFVSHIKPSGKVLDIGCAVGIAINVLGKKGFDMYGIEISPKMAEYAKKRNPNSNIIIGDFLKTNFKENFDGVLTFAFIHLFPKKDIVKIFKKIKTILNPGGIVLFSSTESNKSKEGWYIKDDYNKKVKRFRKFWTEEELRKTLIEEDFQIIGFKKLTDPYGKIWMDFIVKNKII